MTTWWEEQQQKPLTRRKGKEEKKRKRREMKKENRKNVVQTDPGMPVSRQLTRQCRSAIANSEFFELDQRGKARVA
jgi:hypothetical protein